MLKLFSTLVIFLVTCSIYGQNIVKDTLYANFTPDSIIPFNLPVKEVRDLRNVTPGFISYSQTQKFLLLPVDQEILTKSPLDTEIANSFGSSDSVQTGYILEIKRFVIEQHKGRIYTPYILECDMPLYFTDSTETEYIGMLSYNLKFKPQKRKTPLPTTCETMLNMWHRELKLDLLQTKGYLNNLNTKSERLLINPPKKSHFLNASSSLIIGLNFWQIDGELYFSRPETEQNNRILSNIIRYQNTKDVEVIAFGKRAEHLYHRLNEKWLLDISSNILIGLNKWRVKEDKDLYQMLNFSVSSSQSLCYNKINSNSWNLMIGTYENFYYIAQQKPKLQFGLLMGTGYKF